MVVKTVVHFEIPAGDVERLSKFYTDVFGWKFTKTPMSDEMTYWTISTGPQGKSVPGGMYQKMGGVDSPRNFIQVDPIDKAISSFLSAGGKEMMGKQEVPGIGFTFIGTDPEGNAIGLFEPKRPARRAAAKPKSSKKKKK
jgi:predicted enzyme related to lactoylglutathione lyase